MRKCGDCQLCCKLPPSRDVDKPGNCRCKHLSHARGCKIYPSRPISCRVFRCQWLDSFDTDDMSRPDRCHYLIDPAPDMIVSINNATGEATHIQAVQIWVDPIYPDAWKDQRLLAFLLRRGAEGMTAIIRYGDSVNDFVLMPPQLNGTEHFIVVHNTQRAMEFSAAEIAQSVGSDKLRMKISDEAAAIFGIRA